MSLVEYETTAAPGTEGAPSDTTPPAGAQNTDTSGQPPEAVPYSRFKEVNDQLRPFKELTDMGYDADSLRRLADWEMEFTANPGDSWMALAERLEDLPEPVKQAIIAHKNGGATLPDPQAPPAAPQGAPPSEPTTSYEEPPPWAEPLIQDYMSRQEREEAERVSAANREVLQGIMKRWNEQDQQEGIEIPDTVKLSFIAGAARSATDVDQILEIARREALEFRTTLVGRTGDLAPRPGVEPPRSVPGGAVTPSAPPVTPKTLAEATRMAKADLEAGRLQR